jgi:hypothetical protein
MRAGQAITLAMRKQRRSDLIRLRRGLRSSDRNAFDAWLMWGWSLIPGSRSLGMPGLHFPYWYDRNAGK